MQEKLLANSIASTAILCYNIAKCKKAAPTAFFVGQTSKGDEMAIYAVVFEDLSGAQQVARIGSQSGFFNDMSLASKFMADFTRMVDHNLAGSPTTHYRIFGQSIKTRQHVSDEMKDRLLCMKATVRIKRIVQIQLEDQSFIDREEPTEGE